MGETYQIKDQNGIYYLTFQVVGWADIFTRKCYKDIIIDSLKFCRENKGLELFAYIIMSNHVHLIIRSRFGKLSDLVRDFKKHTSRLILNEIKENRSESRKKWLQMIFKYHAKFNKRAGKNQLWTHENHAVELDTNEMIDSRIEYIHQNAVRAGWVLHAEHYLYSSARNYANLEAVLEIDLL